MLSPNIQTSIKNVENLGQLQRYGDAEENMCFVFCGFFFTMCLRIHRDYTKT